MSPLISVIIPAYNSERYVRATVESILGQGTLQIIVIDDASTDGTAEALRDLPVEIVRLSENRGPAHAKNIGLLKARGELICFHDSDDLMLVEGLAWRAAWMQENPEVPAILGAVHEVIDETGAIRDFRPVLANVFSQVPELLDWRWVERNGPPPFPMTIGLFRRDFIDEIGVFDSRLRQAEDRDYFFRVMKQRACRFVNRPVYQYRVHGKNLSTQAKKNILLPNEETERYRQFVDAQHGLI